MAQVLANGLTLEYETFGRPDHPAILLIMGLGAQLTVWPDALCQSLAAGGYYVIRYDNRDVGLSSRLDDHRTPRLMRCGMAYKLRLPLKPVYTLDDMAADALGLLDALRIRRAHIVGASMGGMIAQLIAARHADRVRSLVLVMTSSGNPKLPGPSWRVGLQLVIRPDASDRAQLIDYAIRTKQMVGSPAYPLPLHELRAHAERTLARGHYPQGAARQMLAVLAAGSRVPLLGRIAAPTLIIHGRADKLVPVSAAYDLARHIRGAQLDIIPGMGHDLPAALLPRMAASVLRHMAAAEHQHREAAEIRMPVSLVPAAPKAAVKAPVLRMPRMLLRRRRVAADALPAAHRDQRAIHRESAGT